MTHLPLLPLRNVNAKTVIFLGNSVKTTTTNVTKSMVPKARCGVPMASHRSCHIGLLRYYRRHANFIQSFAFTSLNLQENTNCFAKQPLRLNVTGPTSFVKRPTERKLHKSLGICQKPVSMPSWSHGESSSTSLYRPLPPLEPHRHQRDVHLPER